MKKGTMWGISVLLAVSAFWFARADFPNSLHATRAGKAYWYSKDNGGFETLTGIPMDSLACQNCHAPTLADGTPVDPATYEPSCADCHDFATQGTNVPQSICLGCHSRQKTEITLAQNPNVGAMFSDVHRDRGMECMDCHTRDEIHGGDNDPDFISMFEPGAMETSCMNEGCHPPANLVSNTAHDLHSDAVYCNACHAQTVVTCYNCHFETELAIDKKRFYGPPPLNGFAMLVRDGETDMVTTASFQSVTYGDTTFYAIGPYNAHTISEEARDCTDCHNSAIVQGYNSTGAIPVVQWDAAQSKLVNTRGVIPVPPDWQQALKLDFVRYTGDPSDPIANPGDPTQWAFMKSGADLGQMLFAQPLTMEQMAKLSAQVTALEGEPAIPGRFELRQNYPNPFNPTTTVEFYLHRPAEVTLKVYDVLGVEVLTVMSRQVRGAGVHTATVDARGLASGTYVYRLESSEFNLARTMTVVK